jgi:hypothetical protein
MSLHAPTQASSPDPYRSKIACASAPRSVAVHKPSGAPAGVDTMAIIRDKPREGLEKRLHSNKRAAHVEAGSPVTACGSFATNQSGRSLTPSGQWATERSAAHRGTLLDFGVLGDLK